MGRIARQIIYMGGKTARRYRQEIDRRNRWIRKTALAL